jgi:hypothetical protein
MKQMALKLVYVGVLMTLIGFFLPWARIDLKAPGVMDQISKTEAGSKVTAGMGKLLGKVKETVGKVTDQLPGEIPKQVSGFQVPQLANQENTQVAIAIMELLTGQNQNIGLKSYGVYVLPGLAVLLGLLLTSLGGKPAVVLSSTAVAALVAGGGFFKLLTANTEALFIAVTIGSGLWLSLTGYGLIAVGGAISFANRNE